LSVIKT